MYELQKKDKYKVLVIKSYGIAAPHIMDHLAEGFSDLGYEAHMYDVHKELSSISPESLSGKVHKLVEAIKIASYDFAICYGVSGVMPVKCDDPSVMDFAFPKKDALRYHNNNTHILALLRVPFVLYFGDDPFISEFNIHAYKEAPRRWIATWDPYYNNQLIREGFGNSFELPLATSLHHFSSVNRDELDKKYISDISFIGSPTTERVETLETISNNFNLAVYGQDNWKQYPSMIKCYRGAARYPDETNLVYNGSKITIEIKTEQVKSAFTQKAIRRACRREFCYFRR